MPASISDALHNLLSTIRRHGDFYVSGKNALFAPDLVVEGVGRIALPLLPAQAEQLVAVAERAPYGRGAETRLDLSVRQTWQIACDAVHLGGRHWPETLNAIVARVAQGLGVSGPIVPQFYKLLIYDPGSFFIEHRDTEKAAGMFATLVLVLPSACSGGELMIRHGERTVDLDLACDDPSEACFAAFYADCVHEVRPVTAGYRLTLVYNLIRQDKGQPPGPPVHDEQQAALTTLLHEWVAAGNLPGDTSPVKLIYPLEHAYTQAEISFSALKGVDAARAAVLHAAARAAECELHVALVTIDESGSAEAVYMPRGRGRWREDGFDQEEFEIGEIFERSQRIVSLQRPDGTQAAINALPFSDSELVPEDAFADEEPDEQHFHEAAGNEGASFERSYRRAALVLWPRSRTLDVIHGAGLRVAVPYLAHLAQRWSEAGQDRSSALWSDAHALSGRMLRDWPGMNGRAYAGHSVAAMLACLKELRDEQRIEALLSEVCAAGSYDETVNEALLRGVSLLPLQRAAELIEKVVAGNAALQMLACTRLLEQAARNPLFAGAASLLHPAALALVESLLSLRTPAVQAGSWTRAEPVGADLIAVLLEGLCRMQAEPLAERVVEHIVSGPEARSMDQVLVPAALQLAQRPALDGYAAVQSLRAACLRHLRERILQPLEPPSDFARPGNVSCSCAHCAELNRFLVDPVRKVWELKAAESLRSHVAQSIRSKHCDLDCRTEKRSRPYSLVCTKNQAGYERRCAQRERDLDYVAQLSG